jgi:orotidine-5'-phosphate decarboxylase
LQPKDRIIVALDVDNAYRAIQLIGQLRNRVGVFKVGLELVTSTGVEIFDKLRDAGAERIFYDAKIHDIPNTVAGAMRGVVRRGAWCVTVHATGGSAMLRAAVETAQQEAEEFGTERPRILGVTALTSISPEILRDELRVSLPVEEYVTHLANLAREAGCDGIIASPQEITAVRGAIPDPNFLVITPGVRPAGRDTDDQARVLTPGDAIRSGSSYLVIGRPIVAALDPVAAAERIAEEIAEAID